MNTEDRLRTAHSLLANWETQVAEPEPNRLDITLLAENLLPAVGALHEAGWGYLSAITGLDRGVEAGVIEVLYHFCAAAAVLTLRVRTARAGGRVPSVSKVIPSAAIFERELQEMFGVTLEGLESSGYLFLPDDWTPGVYPQLKDAVLESTAAQRKE